MGDAGANNRPPYLEVTSSFFFDLCNRKDRMQVARHIRNYANIRSGRKPKHDRAVDIFVTHYFSLAEWLLLRQRFFFASVFFFGASCFRLYYLSF